MAPIARIDIARLAASVLTSSSADGFANTHRDQLITCTGPKLYTGTELARLVPNPFSVGKKKFEDIETLLAKGDIKMHKDIDPSGVEYLLEYYSLVRDGKTNVLSSCAFVNITGEAPQQLKEVMEKCVEQFKPEIEEEPARKRQKSDILRIGAYM